MPLARQLSVLSLYDVLTDLIPGATVVLFAFLVFKVETTVLASSNTIFVFVVLLVSLLVGHVVQWLRGKFGKQPGEFQRLMKAVRDDSDEVNSVQKDFLEGTNNYFEIDNEFDDGERFRLVLSYLETRPAVRALRFQSVYSFYRSLFVAALIGVGLSIVALGLHACQSNLPVRGLPYILFTGLSAAVLVYASWERRDKFEKAFVGYVIREFHNEQIAEEKEMQRNED